MKFLLVVLCLILLAPGCRQKAQQQKADEDPKSPGAKSDLEEKAGGAPAERVARPSRSPSGILAPKELPAPRSRPFADWRELEPGMELLQSSLSVGEKPVRFAVLRIQPAHHPFRIAISENLKSPGRTLNAYLRNYRAKAAISGGFLKTFYPPLPLGMVKSDGQLMNRPAEGDLLTGVVAIRGNSLRIAPFRDVDAAKWSDCLQSGPLLIQGGKTVLQSTAVKVLPSTRDLLEKTYDRAFIATDAENRVLLGVTDAMTIMDLSRWLIRPAAQGGLECSSALNLSGGEDRGLLINAGGKRFALGDVNAYIANAIVVH